MNKRLTGQETEEDILKLTAQDNFKLVVSFLRGEHEKILTATEKMRVWLTGDGFGELNSIAELHDMEFDWSHIRDSSPRAQAAMAQVIRDILANRAHPGRQFCAKCLDSGLHLPNL
jgi:hypothetical protein